VKEINSKKSHVRLDQSSYRALHRRILKRDRWRCQACGSMLQLQVHHMEFRSQLGEDREENLITLCAECHATLHQTGVSRS
jgi:5-methylcytosine-specific restriction endonuclease McrA